MIGSFEGHFGQLTEFVDGSRTSNRRQDTKMMARIGVSQELQTSENTIDKILKEDIESFLTAKSDSGSWQICTMKNVFMLQSSNRQTN